MEKRINLFTDVPYEDMKAMEEDEDGIVCFYYKYFHKNSEYVYNWIWSRLRDDPTLVDEIHQETMLKALENRHRLREVNQCKTWLCTIASHLIADRFRARQKESTTSWEGLLDSEKDRAYEDETDLTFREVAERSDNRVLIKCLEQLSENQKYVICQHHYGGFTFQQIAKMMGESPNTVSSWYYRGCKKLRILLNEEGGFTGNE